MVVTSNAQPIRAGTPALDALVTSLAALDWPHTAGAAIAELFAAARIADANLAPYIAFRPERYLRNCVYRDERFELLVLCWSSGSSAPVHDHGASRCFLQVQRGALDVETFDILAGGRAPGAARLRPAGVQTLRAGDIDVLTPARNVHRVAAPAEAISLHVYAPPLERFLIFDPARSTCRGAVSRDDTPPAGR